MDNPETLATTGKIDTPDIQTHDRSLSWLGTCTPINPDRVKQVLYTRTFHQ
jgi:hypothetical protein